MSRHPAVTGSPQGLVGVDGRGKGLKYGVESWNGGRILRSDQHLLSERSNRGIAAEVIVKYYFPFVFDL